MSVVIVTGSAGLIGSEAVSYFCDQGHDVIGIDNNMRKTLFGEDADTQWNRIRLEKQYKNYQHRDVDIRNREEIEAIFRTFHGNIQLIIHAAAQPSHDWAARDPYADFTINAQGTLVLLESFRQFCPNAVFIFCSTNKVYGDLPNSLPLLELENRYELPEDHRWFPGIDETMSIDQCTHSLFGASKVAADVLVQEYGNYFDLMTGVFRGGCLTGPSHSGTELHGFLSYLVRACILGTTYKVFGYKGKQVRDNIHSYDLVRAFDCYFKNPRKGEVYNLGGSRHSHCSILEAVEMCQEIGKKKLATEYVDQNRKGDHMWWISDVGKFQSHYPKWSYQYTCKDIINEIFDMQKAVV